MKFYLTTDEKDERPIYLTGNFNKWNPRDADYIMEELEYGHYFSKFRIDF